MQAASTALNWLQLHYLELIAVITGLLYIFYTIRENILLWLFGILSSGLYIWIFFKSGIYAYSILYVYYVLIGFYGWYNWSVKKESPEKLPESIPVHKATGRYLSSCIIVTCLLSIPLYFLLKKFTTSDMAMADALLTSGGMVATWMLTQKLIEQWLFWIIIDLLSMGVMIYKELYPSALLFLVYTLLAVKGYIAWKKELKVTIKGYSK
jgi:nicotinamide mononucleotide transporter